MTVQATILIGGMSNGKQIMHDPTSSFTMIKRERYDTVWFDTGSEMLLLLVCGGCPRDGIVMRIVVDARRCPTFVEADQTSVVDMQVTYTDHRPTSVGGVFSLGDHEDDPL